MLNEVDMKLSSISLIASALAATAGNTIAAPGPLYARSLQQGNLFERDIDNVDLFTRNPPDPEHSRQPHMHLTDDGWHYPVGPSPALPPELLVDLAKDHVPQLPLADPGHYQHYPHPHLHPADDGWHYPVGPSPALPPELLANHTKDHVPQLPLADPGHYQHYPHHQDHVPPGPQPLVEHTRDYRQNVHGSSHAPPNDRHAEPRHRSSSGSHSAPLQPPHDAQQPALHQHPNPALSAAHQTLWQPPYPKNLSQQHIALAHEHRITGRYLFIAKGVARHAANEIRERAGHYTALAGNIGLDSDRHFQKQRSLLGGEEVSQWACVRRSAVTGRRRADTEIKKLWDVMERERGIVKKGQDAKTKEIVRELNEHDWNLWHPGQPYPRHPEQHQ